MVCYLCVIYVCIGVVIGFEDMLYFVDESEGEVIVNIAVLTGTLSSEVTVQLTQNPDTATG